MAKKDKTGGMGNKDKANPKAAAVQHMKEALARVQAARSAAASQHGGPPDADRGGKGPKGAATKGRMFRHQGR